MSTPTSNAASPREPTPDRPNPTAPGGAVSGTPARGAPSPGGPASIPAPTPLVEARGVSVTFGARGNVVRAVDSVDLVVPRGRTVGLVGESGSGKSTLGFALAGLLRPTAGTILFDGDDVTAARPEQRRLLARRAQVIFQDPFGSFNPTLTVGASLGEALRYNLGLPQAEIDTRLAAIVTDVGLAPDVLHRRPRQFSGGQRQRLAIARALVTGAEFVVCDEVVSALDLSVQAQVLNLLRELAARRGLAYLFISHDLDVVRLVSDEIAVMYRGRIVEHGDAAAIATAPRHPYTRRLVAATLVPDVAEQRRRRAARRAARDGTRLAATDALGTSVAPAASIASSSGAIGRGSVAGGIAPTTAATSAGRRAPAASAMPAAAIAPSVRAHGVASGAAHGIADGCPYVERCPYASARCTTERPPLVAHTDDRDQTRRLIACWNIEEIDDG